MTVTESLFRAGALSTRTREALTAARAVGRMRMDPDTMRLWEEVYPRLSEGLPGLLGALPGAPRRRLCALHCYMRCSTGLHRFRKSISRPRWHYGPIAKHRRVTSSVICS